MEIIDILTPDNDNLPYFTVNTAVKYVNVASITGFGSPMSCGNAAYKKFTRGDNFIILSAGYFIPERFTIFEYTDVLTTKYSAPIMGLLAKVGGLYLPVNTFGNGGYLKIPFPNYEFSLGTFVDTELNNFTTSTFELSLYFTMPSDMLSISMIDVPAALNGEVIKITPFIKILHNLQLT